MQFVVQSSESFKIAVDVRFTFGGPLINTNGQVLDTEGRPVPGLFAVGNAAGGLFYDNYVGGAQLTSASVIGRQIADYVKTLAK